MRHYARKQDVVKDKISVQCSEELFRRKKQIFSANSMHELLSVIVLSAKVCLTKSVNLVLALNLTTCQNKISWFNLTGKM